MEPTEVKQVIQREKQVFLEVNRQTIITAAEAKQDTQRKKQAFLVGQQSTIIIAMEARKATARKALGSKLYKTLFQPTKFCNVA